MGVPAPNFHLLSDRGYEKSLRDCRHWQPVILLFMHPIDCPICRERLLEFADAYEEYLGRQKFSQ